MITQTCSLLECFKRTHLQVCVHCNGAQYCSDAHRLLDFERHNPICVKRELILKSYRSFVKRGCAKRLLDHLTAVKRNLGNVSNSIGHSECDVKKYWKNIMYRQPVAPVPPMTTATHVVVPELVMALMDPSWISDSYLFHVMVETESKPIEKEEIQDFEIMEQFEFRLERCLRLNPGAYFYSKCKRHDAGLESELSKYQQTQFVPFKLIYCNFCFVFRDCVSFQFHKLVCPSFQPSYNLPLGVDPFIPSGLAL